MSTNNTTPDNNEGASGFNGSEGQPDATNQTSGPDFNSLEQGIEAMQADATQAFDERMETLRKNAAAAQERAAEATKAADKANEEYQSAFVAGPDGAASSAQEATASNSRFIDKSVFVSFIVLWGLLWMAIIYFGNLAAVALAGPFGPLVFMLAVLMLTIVPVSRNWMMKMADRGARKLQDLVDYFKVRKAIKAEQQAKNLANVMANFVDPVAAV